MDGSCQWRLLIWCLANDNFQFPSFFLDLLMGTVLWERICPFSTFAYLVFLFFSLVFLYKSTDSWIFTYSGVFIMLTLFMWLHRLVSFGHGGCSFRLGPMLLQHTPSFFEHFLLSVTSRHSRPSPGINYFFMEPGSFYWRVELETKVGCWVCSLLLGCPCLQATSWTE